MKRDGKVIEAAKRLNEYKDKMLKGNPHITATIETVLAYVRESMKVDNHG